MKAAAIPSLLLAIILLLSSASTSFVGADQPAGSPSSAAIEDKDDDRVDDRIKQEDGPFDVVVFFDQSPAAGAIADVEAKSGHLKLTKFKSFNGLGIENVNKQTIAGLSQKAGVEFIDILSRAGAKEVTAGLDVSTRALKARSSPSYLSTAENLGLTGSGVTICIIDTGVDDTIHESLQGKFAAGFNALTDTAENPDDDNGHGTHVAGIALGSGGPLSTYRGVAPAAKLVDVKALDFSGYGTWMDLIQGIDFCIANKDTFGIDIISLSVGSTLFSSGKDAASLEVDNAVDAGLVAVACAGNYGSLGYNTIAAPGAADKAITVGALDDLNTVNRADHVIASYSSRGLRASDGDADVMDEYKPDVTAPGTQIVSARYNTVNGYVEMSGCSMATPAVAGIAALMLEQNPLLSPDQIKSQLRINAEDKGSTYNPSVDPKYDPDYGWGEAQFSAPATGFPIVHMSDTTQTVGSVTFAGRQINAEYVDSASQLIGDKIDSITVRLQKLGAPTGHAQVGIFNADRSEKKLFDTIDVATLSASFQDYEFKLPGNELYTIQPGDRIGIKYAGGTTASNAISVMNDRDFADPFDGNKSYRTRYESSWIVSYGEDMYMVLKQTHAEISTLYPLVHMSDTTESSGSLVYAGRPLNAEWAKVGSSLIGKQVDSITVRLQKVGAPPGTFTVGVYDSNLQLKKAFGIVSTAALSATYTDLEFKLPNNELYTIQQDDRIGVFYNGGSANAGVSVMIDRNTADPFDGTNSQRVRYEAAWLYYDTGEDMYMILKQTHG